MRRARFIALAAGTLGANALPGCGGPHAPLPSPATVTPKGTYERSVAGIREVIAHDQADPTLISQAMPRLYQHGARVRDAVVLFHGFTNCPQQFDELARGFFARGCNVYVPRIPYHGKKDRLTWDLAKLSVPILETFATESYDLANGLGDRVSALGLSLGGTLALWLGQTAPLALSVPVSPFLMPIGFSKGVGTLAMRSLDALPDMYWWWDPRVKAKSLPTYAYPGYPTHALAQCVLSGSALFEQLPRKPLTQRVTLVTNANEPAVNNEVAYELLGDWKNEGIRYDHFVFTDLGAPRHDISTQQPSLKRERSCTPSSNRSCCKMLDHHAALRAARATMNGSPSCAPYEFEGTFPSSRDILMDTGFPVAGLGLLSTRARRAPRKDVTMRPVGLVVAALVLAMSAPALATGNVRIQQSDGSVKTYTGVTMKVANKTLTLISADKVSTVVISGADLRSRRRDRPLYRRRVLAAPGREATQRSIQERPRFTSTRPIKISSCRFRPRKSPPTR